MAIGEQCAGFLRMGLAFLGCIFLLAGIGLQFFAAGNLYGIRLESLCKTHSGSGEPSDTKSFTTLLEAAFEKRNSCLSKPAGPDRDACCAVYAGLCASPEVTNINIFDGKGNDGKDENPSAKMALVTKILGTFIGVYNPASYDAANPEFWCKNCPNDWRKNCPFDPVDSNNATAGMQVDKVCSCPGGTLSPPGTGFWATIADNQLATKYLLCSDKAQVYEAWVQAVFPQWSKEEFAQVRSRFESKCWQSKGSIGYILTAGPVLALFAGIFSVAGFFRSVANTPIPIIAFNLGMVAMAITFVSFWALSLTGASNLISRYAICNGYDKPILELVHKNVGDALAMHAPVLYNGAPCADINSAKEQKLNPFITELGAYNGGYVTGGVLVLLALICMLAISAKVSDVVMEKKLQGDNPADVPEARHVQLKDED